MNKPLVCEISFHNICGYCQETVTLDHQLYNSREENILPFMCVWRNRILAAQLLHYKYLEYCVRGTKTGTGH